LIKQFSHKKFLYTSIRLNLRMEQVFPAAHLNTTPQFGPNRRSSDYIIRLSSDLNLQCYAVIPTSWSYQAISHHPITWLCSWKKTALCLRPGYCRCTEKDGWQCFVWSREPIMVLLVTPVWTAQASGVEGSCCKT